MRKILVGCLLIVMFSVMIFPSPIQQTKATSLPKTAIPYNLTNMNDTMNIINTNATSVGSAGNYYGCWSFTNGSVYPFIDVSGTGALSVVATYGTTHNYVLKHQKTSSGWYESKTNTNFNTVYFRFEFWVYVGTYSSDSNDAFFGLKKADNSAWVCYIFSHSQTGIFNCYTETKAESLAYTGTNGNWLRCVFENNCTGFGFWINDACVWTAGKTSTPIAFMDINVNSQTSNMYYDAIGLCNDTAWTNGYTKDANKGLEQTITYNQTYTFNETSLSRQYIKSFNCYSNMTSNITMASSNTINQSLYNYALNTSQFQANLSPYQPTFINNTINYPLNYFNGSCSITFNLYFYNASGGNFMWNITLQLQIWYYSDYTTTSIELLSQSSYITHWYFDNITTNLHYYYPLSPFGDKNVSMASGYYQMTVYENGTLKNNTNILIVNGSNYFTYTPLSIADLLANMNTTMINSFAYLNITVNGINYSIYINFRNANTTYAYLSGNQTQIQTKLDSVIANQTYILGNLSRIQQDLDANFTILSGDLIGMNITLNELNWTCNNSFYFANTTLNDILMREITLDYNLTGYYQNLTIQINSATYNLTTLDGQYFILNNPDFMAFMSNQTYYYTQLIGNETYTQGQITALSLQLTQAKADLESYLDNIQLEIDTRINAFSDRENLHYQSLSGNMTLGFNNMTAYLSGVLYNQLLNMTNPNSLANLTYREYLNLSTQLSGLNASICNHIQMSNDSLSLQLQSLFIISNETLSASNLTLNELPALETAIANILHHLTNEMITINGTRYSFGNSSDPVIFEISNGLISARFNLTYIIADPKVVTEFLLTNDTQVWIWYMIIDSVVCIALTEIYNVAKNHGKKKIEEITEEIKVSGENIEVKSKPIKIETERVKNETKSDSKLVKRERDKPSLVKRGKDKPDLVKRNDKERIF